MAKEDFLDNCTMLTKDIDGDKNESRRTTMAKEDFLDNCTIMLTKDIYGDKNITPYTNFCHGSSTPSF